jgi:hypothetical protein
MDPQAVDGGLHLQARGAEDAGRLAIVLSVLACLAALTAPVYTPAVVGAVLAGVVSLSVGVWVTMEGRGHRRIRSVNLCVAFLAHVVAVAQGGHFFDPGLLLMIYYALAA